MPEIMAKCPKCGDTLHEVTADYRLICLSCYDDRPLNTKPLYRAERVTRMRPERRV